MVDRFSSEPPLVFNVYVCEIQFFIHMLGGLEFSRHTYNAMQCVPGGLEFSHLMNSIFRTTGRLEFSYLTDARC
jgi:hypothetical protein